MKIKWIVIECNSSRTECILRKQRMYLIFNFVSICERLVCILVWMKSCYKFIVVNISITISIKNVCNSTHFKSACRELCRTKTKPQIFSLFIPITMSGFIINIRRWLGIWWQILLMKKIRIFKQVKKTQSESPVLPRYWIKMSTTVWPEDRNKSKGTQ